MIKDILDEFKDEVGDLKILSCVYKKSTENLSVVIQYSNETLLSEEQKYKIKSSIERLVAPYCKKINIALRKNFVDIEIVVKRFKSILKNNFPMISMFAENNLKSYLIGDVVVIEFDIDCAFKEYVENKKICKIIEDLLTKDIGLNFDIKINYTNSCEPDCSFSNSVDVDINTERFIKVFNVQKFIGEEIQKRPMYIKDLNSVEDHVCICGAISSLKFSEYKNKTGKIKFFMKAVIKDPTDEISCIMFLSENNISKAKSLIDNTEILLEGKSILNKFGNIEFQIKNISLCEIEKNFKEKIKFKKVPSRYVKVLPEKIDYKEQLSIFSTQKCVNDYLMQHDIVVFDLETTGLNFVDSEIIEIGAIKIKKGGHISEKFSCFVKPKNLIPSEITEITGISNEDVKNGVDLADAIADFYKFTREATLVGHNVNFDYGFISYYGQKEGYDFSVNEKMDTYALSTKLIKGLKNYKLKNTQKWVFFIL